MIIVENFLLFGRTRAFWRRLYSTLELAPEMWFRKWQNNSATEFLIELAACEVVELSFAYWNSKKVDPQNVFKTWKICI